MSVQSLSLADDKLLEIIKDSNTQLESRLNGIKTSAGIFDFILDMSNIWLAESLPVKDEMSFGGDKAKYFIFKKIISMCSLELARRRVMFESKDETQYLASIISANKLIF